MEWAQPVTFQTSSMACLLGGNGAQRSFTLPPDVHFAENFFKLAEVQHSGVVPFSFSSPSPDELVLQKQKQAFQKAKSEYSLPQGFTPC